MVDHEEVVGVVGVDGGKELIANLGFEGVEVVEDAVELGDRVEAGDASRIASQRMSQDRVDVADVRRCVG